MAVLTPAAFTACKAAHRRLLARRGKPGTAAEFPDLDRIVAELESRLAQHSTKWRDITFTLTPDQRKSANRMTVLWISKSRSRGLRDISNYCYL